ncbi:MAG: hypothetical protein VXW87_03985 [Pseudomonadota bacterium]|nr:hypothetical protein [Pseudomonadota bacterium]
MEEKRKNKKHDKNNIAYVSNMLHVVPRAKLPFDDNGALSDSGSSSDEEDLSLTEHFSEAFPAIKLKDNRGKISSDSVTTIPNKSYKPTSSNLAYKIQTECFFYPDSSHNPEQSAQLSQKKAETALRTVVLLNIPRSPSKTDNKRLAHELAATTQRSDDRTAYIACFWDPQAEWSHKSKGRPKPKINYRIIRQYYHYLKHTSPSLAKRFFNQMITISNQMIPYRELREYCKNHPATLSYIQYFNQLSQPNIYLYFCDSDFIKLYENNQPGVLTVMSQSIKSQKTPPDIIWGGYSYHSESLSTLEFASTVDMIVRESTSKIIPFGVYIAEPSFAVRVIGNALKESFCTKENDYKTPKESKILVDHICDSRGPKTTSVFMKNGRVITPAPNRAQFNKLGSPLKLSSKVSFKNGNLTNWLFDDLRTLFHCVSQSHAHPRDWALNLLYGLSLKDTTSLFGHTIKNRKTIRDIAISLISRLYNYFNPLVMASLNQKANQSPEEALLYVCDQYHLKLTRKIAPKVSQRTDDLWVKIDGISTKKGIIEALECVLLKESDGKKIEKAARSSGVEVAEFLKTCLTRPSAAA